MSIYLVQSDNGAKLCDVIGAADATNHAIPTPNELSHAFTKLLNAGVIEIKGNNYKIDPDKSSDIELAYKMRGGLFQSGLKGEAWLKRSNLKVVSNSSIVISQKDVKEAYDEYTSKIRKN